MNGVTHLLAGAALALWMPDAPAGVLCLVGSLAPDLDAGANATIANPFKLKIFNAPLRALAWGARKTTGHRGWLHRAPALLAVWAAWYVWRGAWLGLAAGWSSHVALDMLTKRGIKLFGGRTWGLLPRSFRILSGGTVERWLMRPGLVAVMVWRGWELYSIL